MPTAFVPRSSGTASIELGFSTPIRTLSAAPFLQEMLGRRTNICGHVVKVQKLWQEIYNLIDLPTDGSQWDRLFAEGASSAVGQIPVRALASRGHTLAPVSYVAGDAAFVYNTLMLSESGTSRAVQGGDAGQLYRRIQTTLALPHEMHLFIGHDNAPAGRGAPCEAAVAEQKAQTIQLKDGPSEAELVARRIARDQALPLPKRMLVALQITTCGGLGPDPEVNGRCYLKLPLDYLEPRGEPG